MSSTTSTDFGAALTDALQGGYVAHLTGQTYTVTSPIVIHITSTMQGAMGIDGGGATLVSQVTDGSPLIQIIVDPGVDVRYLTLSNFKIQGTGQEGDGIQILADGNDRWLYNWNIDNVTVEHVGGYGLDVQGSVFEGLVSNSWMNDNGQGGAYFSHSSGGGQASALRWYGGGFQNNGGAGLTLDNGTRDMGVDHASFVNNNGPGISALWGITSVTESDFQDNQGAGAVFWNYGNFTSNTFSTSGSQTVGISAYLTGAAVLVDNTSTGSGPLADIQGQGELLQTANNGQLVTGPAVIGGGTVGADPPVVSVGTGGVVLPTLEAVTAATTAPKADSTGTGAVEMALEAAFANGSVVHLTDDDIYVVTQTIVINVTHSTQGPVGIDLGGAKILSEITDGSPVIEIIVGPGVDLGSLTLSNFSILGNGQEGAGIKIVVDGADRSLHDWKISNVNVEHVGGTGLDMLGNVSDGVVFNSWMHGDHGGGARFANSAGGGVVSDVEWVGGGFRKNDVAGLIVDNGAHDMTVKGAYFVENRGPGIVATSGITMVRESGFENNEGAGAIVEGPATFTDNTFATFGPQTTAVGGYLESGEQVTLIGVGTEYYGGGADPTWAANFQGQGTLAVGGGGNLRVGPNIAVTAADPVVPTTDPETAPVVSSIATSGAGLVDGTGALNAGDTVTFTMALSEDVTVAGGVPTMLLNDGGTATYSGGSGGSTLTFAYTVQAGRNVADLGVSSISLNGAAIKDSAGLAADLSAVANYNPAGTLHIDTKAPAVTSIVTSGAGITNGSGVLGAGKTVTFTVKMTESVVVTGAPTLALNDGGTATYTGGSGSSTLTFTHTVAAGQNTPDLAVSSLELNGGSIVDGAGNAANLSAATNYNPAGTLQIDTTAPVLAIALAGDTGAFSSDEVTANPALTGTADPGAVVHFTIDGQAIIATATANASGAWSYTPTGLADGQHTIVASETNGAGTTVTASLSFMLDATRPAVTVKLAGGGTTAPNPALTGTGDANAVVHFTVDGVPVAGTVTADASGAWSYTPPDLADGAHTIVASQTDLAGNTGTASLSFTVGNMPAPELTAMLADDTGFSSSDGITTDPTLTGTADPNALVHFTIDGHAVSDTVMTDANGAWSYSPTDLADGTHTIVASQTNAAGGTGITSLSFTLDTEAPIPVLTGAVRAGGNVTLSGATGEADDQISIYDGNTWLGFATTGSDGTWSFDAPAPTSVVHNYGVNATDLAGNEGHTANRLILGSSGANSLGGESGNDIISGNGGNDKITGGRGADTLTGGTGKDTFIYEAAADSRPSAPDTITDFQHGVDKIDFTKIAGIAATNGVPAFQGDITGSGNPTLNPHSVAYLEEGGNTHVLVNTTNYAETVTTTDTHAANMEIVLVGVHLGLTNTDFHHT